MMDRGLGTWTLATFHASAFMLALVLIVYRAGGLDDLLPNLDTVVGLGLFAVLWAGTFLTTRRALASPHLVRAGLRWGGVNGLLFFFVLETLQIITAIASRPANVPLAAIVQSGFFVLAFGTLFSWVIGAAVGLLFALADLALLAAARALAPARND